MCPTFDRLETLLLKAASDARHWDVVCEEVTAILGATGTLLPASNPNFRGLWTAGTVKIKKALIEYLEDGWMRGDAREPVLNLMFERGLCTDDEVYPDRDARFAMPIYRDFLLPWNFGNVCMIRLTTPEGYWPMTVHFSNDHKPLTEHEFGLIRQIQAMMDAATQAAFASALKQIIEFSQFFRASKSEVFLFDADGQQSFMIDLSGRVAASDRIDNLLPFEINETLQAALKDVLLSAPERSLSKSYNFTRDNKNMHVLVVQTPPRLRHFFMKFKTCAIRTEFSASGSVRSAFVRDSFALSESEITTLELLSAGNTPSDIAEFLNLKPASIRQRLKTIYSKVGVNSQVELVAFYLRL